MHFTTIATTAAIASSALATTTTTPFSLQVEGGSKAPNTYLGWAHEGAAINYVFAGGTDPSYNFQLNGTVLSSSYWLGYPGVGYVDEEAKQPFLQIGVMGGGQEGYQLDPSNKGLGFKGDYNGWYVCENANDPYHYPRPSVMYYGDKTPEDDGKLSCEKVKLKAVFEEGSSVIQPQ